jgi:hypothetical protein
MTGSGERLEAAKATPRDGPARPDHPNLTRALHKSNDGSGSYNRWAQDRPEEAASAGLLGRALSYWLAEVVREASGAAAALR